MLQKTSLSIFILLFFLVAQSQNSIYSYTFDNDMESWKSESLSNEGDWTWSQNGKADQGIYWNNRSPIDETENGALVYDGDHIINSNQGNPLLDYKTVVISPDLDFLQYSEVYIMFNQYFRNYESNTYLEVSSNAGATWNTIDLNKGVNRNVETSPKDYEIIDISQFAANKNRVHVRFLIDGKYYFWLLDDIVFYDGYPVVPTVPSYIGEYLTLHGYPYEVDDAGWPYIPNEGIVNFAPGTPQSIKDNLRDDVGAILKETCVCNTLETWTFVDDLLEGGIGLSSAGPTTGANQQVSSSSSASEIDDIDFNKYVKGELTVGSFDQPTIDEILDAHKPPKGNDPIKVAIIDTGVDILHEKLKKVLSLSDDKPENGLDDDDNCYPDNYIGWNFVDDNNNASDDHGHGSHVAGIVAQNILPLHRKNKVQIIPYKTHDFRGLANLFDVTCAMYQSIQDKVSVVNCSWGFYGNESDVLNAAIIKAWKRNITVIAATGNDSLYLIGSPQYPACSKIPNVIAVGSYNLEDKGTVVMNSHFSNYGSKYVDVLAAGVNILSTVPYNDLDYKTGTSMAAPSVAGLAVQKYLSGYSDPILVKESILFDAQDHEHLIFEVLDGNVLLASSVETEISEASESSESSEYAFGSKPKPEVVSTRNGTVKNEMDVSLLIRDREIIFEFHEDYSGVKVYVLNMQGQKFISHEFKNIKKGSIENLELNALPSGLYLLKINEKVHEFVVY